MEHVEVVHPDWQKELGTILQTHPIEIKVYIVLHLATGSEKQSAGRGSRDKDISMSGLGEHDSACLRELDRSDQGEQDSLDPSEQDGLGLRELDSSILDEHEQASPGNVHSNRNWFHDMKSSFQVCMED